MAHTLHGLVRLFFWHMKLGASRAMTYRADFITGFIVSIVVSGIGPFVQYLYFTQTKGYPGWTLQQVLLFQGLLLLWFGVRDLMFGEIRNTVMQLVWKGDFDRLLLKPYPPIGVILCSGFQIGGIGSVVAGILVTALALQNVDLSFSIWTIPLFVLMFVCGLLLFMALSILFCAIVLLIVQMFRIGEIFDKIMAFSEYPINIFPVTVRVALVTLLPFAVWTYYPAQILLGRIDHGIWAAAVFCVIVFWLSLQIWNRCLKNYTSAGG